MVCFRETNWFISVSNENPAACGLDFGNHYIWAETKKILVKIAA